MTSTALRVSRALRLKLVKGSHVGRYFIEGKKSTRVAAGEPDSTVNVAALSTLELSEPSKKQQLVITDRA